MTGTLAAHTLIISFGTCIFTFETQEAEQHKFIKETRTNEPRKDKHVQLKVKVRNRTEAKRKTHKHNTVTTTQRTKKRK